MAKRGSDVDLPSHIAMAWPTLTVIKQANRPLRNQEIEVAVADALHLTEAQRSRLRSRRGNGTRTMLAYRLAWSRTLLKNMGAITNPEPAFWQITEAGTGISSEDVQRFAKSMFEKLPATARV